MLYDYPVVEAICSVLPLCNEFVVADMAAGDTIFGEHETLIAQVLHLLNATQKMLDEDEIYPVVLAARFHCFFEFLHSFRDGNGRIGRLFANFILLKKQHPII